MAETRHCHAKADTNRALLAFAFPLGALFLGAWFLTEKGYSLIEYPSLVGNGGVTLPGQIGGWVGFVLWAVFYWPPAFHALIDGPCIVSSDLDTLYLPGRRTLALPDIADVTIAKGFFQDFATVSTATDHVRFSVVLVNEAWRRRLQELPSFTPAR